MCIASFIGDEFKKTWNPGWVPLVPSTPAPVDDSTFPKYEPFKLFDNLTVTREEFSALKKEVEDLRVLLEKAKFFDTDHDEPNCEMEEKIALVKQVGKQFEIDFTGVFEGDLPERIKATNEPWLVCQYKFNNSNDEWKVVARFETEALAQKFAEYVVNYSGDRVDVIELGEYDYSTLKYGVAKVRDDSELPSLVAAFEHYEEAQEWAETSHEFYRVVFL